MIKRYQVPKIQSPFAHRWKKLSQATSWIFLLSKLDPHPNLVNILINYLQKPIGSLKQPITYVVKTWATLLIRTSFSPQEKKPPFPALKSYFPYHFFNITEVQLSFHEKEKDIPKYKPNEFTNCTLTTFCKKKITKSRSNIREE